MNDKPVRLSPNATYLEQRRHMEAIKRNNTRGEEARRLEKAFKNWAKAKLRPDFDWNVR